MKVIKESQNIQKLPRNPYRENEHAICINAQNCLTIFEFCFRCAEETKSRNVN